VSHAPDGQPPRVSNLQLRVVSSVVLIVVVLGVTLLGGVAFRLLAAAIGAAILYEWCAMAGNAANRRHQMTAGLLMGAVLAALVAGYTAPILFLLLGVSVIVCLADGRLGGHGTWAAAGLAYAGLSALSLGLLRDGDRAGLVAVLFLYAVVWATDISAYFVGRRIGGPKLAPQISPGKTLSGALGGMVGGVALGVFLATASGIQNLPLLAVAAFLLSLIAQAGDLFESWLKRRHGLKDSGSLIPGHGGVMDRVDGLVAAAFALYVIGWISGGADNPAQTLFPI
jgi:phosphatidate cytidylyltransferase